MTNSLLRSGCPDDFLTLGENGQAIFDSAWQIRETLRLRKQQAVADALAIPQINDSGSRIDWYAPNAGRVTSWAAASEEQRISALRYLEHCQTNVNLLSTQCLRSEKTALRLFGSLLEKVLKFPGSQYVYLVDDKPVITFWGFVNHNEASQDDSLACLQTRTPHDNYTALAPRVPEPVSEKAREPESVPTTTRAPDIAAVYSLEAEPVVTPTDIVVAQPRRRWAPVVILTLFIVLTSSGYLILRPQSNSNVEVIATTDVIKPVVIESHQQPPTPFLATTLPLMLATVTPPTGPEIPEPVVSAEPTPKGALVLSADELKKGSTQFLNGTWQVRVQFSDPIAGKPPALRYRISNNKGTVRLFNSDNIACKAQVYSGLHQSGTLMIKSRGNARCDDGTRHVLPEISCKAGINGVAECLGRYEGDNLVPVTFQKVSN